ncbi:hypothetical protein T492DRAFT_1033196, partial [Pavlovales sp. CCMP2436]
NALQLRFSALGRLQSTASSQLADAVARLASGEITVAQALESTALSTAVFERAATSAVVPYPLPEYDYSPHLPPPPSPPLSTPPSNVATSELELRDILAQTLQETFSKEQWQTTAAVTVGISCCIMLCFCFLAAKTWSKADRDDLLERVESGTPRRHRTANSQVGVSFAKPVRQALAGVPETNLLDLSATPKKLHTQLPRKMVLPTGDSSISSTPSPTMRTGFTLRDRLGVLGKRSKRGSVTKTRRDEPPAFDSSAQVRASELFRASIATTDRDECPSTYKDLAEVRSLRPDSLDQAPTTQLDIARDESQPVAGLPPAESNARTGTGRYWPATHPAPWPSWAHVPGCSLFSSGCAASGAGVHASSFAGSSSTDMAEMRLSSPRLTRLDQFVLRLEAASSNGTDGTGRSQSDARRGAFCGPLGPYAKNASVPTKRSPPPPPSFALPLHRTTSTTK